MAEQATASVVVTGAGSVCSLGTTQAEFWESVRAGRCAVGPVPELQAAGYDPGHAAHVPGYPDLPEPLAAAHDQFELPPDRAAAFAVWSARQALASARIESDDEDTLPWDRHRCAVLVGTTLGGYRLRASAIAAQSPLGSEALAWGGYDGPALAVARTIDARGPCRAISVACCSGTMAIGTAVQLIRSGQCDAALAGGADALSTFVYSGFAALKALSQSASRPFARDRDGLNLGEGACMLLLEREERARSRGAPILARIAGFGTAGDANHMTGPHPEGLGAARGMAAALRDAGEQPDAIDVINLHGTGTPYNDRMEALAVRRVFGDRTTALPVNSIKPTIGHTMGAAGAFEAALGLHVLRTGLMPPTPNVGPDEVDEECAFLDVVLGSARETGAKLYLTTNSGFGGTNAALVLEKAE